MTLDPEQGTTLAVQAYGDPDDHLRITVLVAAAHRDSHVPSGTEAAQACLEPRTSWSQRIDAFADVLSALADVGTCRIVLVDPDALDPGPASLEARFNDRFFTAQRRQLLELVLEQAPRSNWGFRRPRASSRRVTDALDEPDEVPDLEDDSNFAIAAPELRPLLRSLVEHEHLRQLDARRMWKATPEDFNDQLVDVAFDALPHAARVSAQRIAPLRGAQLRNGRLGPFKLAKTATENKDELDERTIERLLECGLLLESPTTPASVEMPRTVRHRLLAWGEHTLGDVLRAQRTAWGLFDESAPLPAQLEAHYHAVRGDDLDNAVSSARYYGADLRELGYRLSRRRHWAQAASIYFKIINEFDNTDAYAWEYYAYNLARANPSPSAEMREAIANAYGEAIKLDRKNPLYVGRALGFRAQCGEDIEIDFHRAMKKYANWFEGEDSEAISYFAEPVLKGVRHARGPAEMRRLASRWEPFLRTFEKTRALLGGHIEHH